MHLRVTLTVLSTFATLYVLILPAIRHLRIGRGRDFALAWHVYPNPLSNVTLSHLLCAPSSAAAMGLVSAPILGAYCLLPKLVGVPYDLAGTAAIVGLVVFYSLFLMTPIVDDRPLHKTWVRLFAACAIVLVTMMVVKLHEARGFAWRDMRMVMSLLGLGVLGAAGMLADNYLYDAPQQYIDFEMAALLPMFWLPTLMVFMHGRRVCAEV